MKQLETLLLEIGSFGKYQRLRFFLLCIPAGLICCYGFSVFIFMSYIPTHHCKVSGTNLSHYFPHINSTNLSREALLEYTIPKELNYHGKEEWAKCVQYDWEAMVNRSIVYFNQSTPTMPCQDGWYFSNEFGNTIVSKWSLVCDRDYYRHLIMTVSSFTTEFGLIFFSYLQDRFGRKPTLFAALTWYIAWGVASCFVPDPFSFMITWSLRCMVTMATFQVPYIMALEFVSTEYRTFVNCAMAVLYALAQPLLALICWYFKDYIQQSLITTIPAIFLYFMWFVIDESPRWLLTIGRDDEAKVILQKMARINGKQFPEDSWDSLLNAAEDEHIPVQKAGSHEAKKPKKISRARACYNYVTSNSFFILFSRCSLAMKTLCITYIWLTCWIVYIGLGLTVEILPADRYLLFSLLGFAELPAVFLNWYLLDRVGRIWPMGVATIIAGVASILTAVAPHSEIWLVVILAVVTKLSITAGFLAIYQLSGEMFPTIIRATGLGFTSLVSGTLATGTPFLIYAAMATNQNMLPMTVFGILTVLGGLLLFILPETAHQPLPDTVEESESMFGIGWRTTLGHLRCRNLKQIRSTKKLRDLADDK